MTRRQKFSGLFLAFLLASCGPDGDDATNNSDPNNTNNTANNVSDVLELAVEVAPAEGQRIMATALNSDGSELAIALQDVADFNQSVVIYSTSDGSELRQMKDFVKPEGFLADSVSVTDLYWSDSGQITALQTYRNRYTWNAETGDVLQKANDIGLADECAGPQGSNVFHPSRNQAFVRKIGEKTNELCRINFDTGEAELIALTEAAGVIESVALDATGDVLWVNYSNPTAENPLSTEIVGTVGYDSQTLGVLGQTLSPQGAARVVGDGYFVSALTSKLFLAPGGELNANDRDVLAAPNANVLSAQNRDSDDVFVIAVPEGTSIGTLPEDDRGNRSFSADGRFGAFDIDDVVHVYDVSGRTSSSALAPEPVPPSGTLSGTVTIDGVTEPITGVCEVIVDDAVGPVVFVASGTTESGLPFEAAAQNLLLYSEYIVRRDGKRYILDNVIAQNLELPFPTASSDGTSIVGGGTLYVFTDTGVFERVEDPTNPTGFDALEFAIAGVCTP